METARDGHFMPMSGANQEGLSGGPLSHPKLISFLLGPCKAVVVSTWGWNGRMYELLEDSYAKTAFLKNLLQSSLS